MDAANVDLKCFTEDFYHKLCGAQLASILETLVYLRHETTVWLELTTLLIPGLNDSDREIEEMTQWVVENLGPDVPWHFTAFHPQWKMRDTPATPRSTLLRAHAIARGNGVRSRNTQTMPSSWGLSCSWPNSVLQKRCLYLVTRPP